MAWLKALICVALIGALLCFRSAIGLPASGQDSAASLLAKPDLSGPLVVAFAQVVEASARERGQPARPAPGAPASAETKADTEFLPEGLRTALAQQPLADPERFADDYIAGFEALEAGPSRTRVQWLKLARSPGVLSAPAAVRLGLRQLEQPTSDRFPDELELEILTQAGELVYWGEPSLAERATIYSQLEALHPAPESRETIQRALFPKQPGAY